MKSTTEDRFHDVESALSALHASALHALIILNIDSVDSSDRIGVHGDFPFISLEYRSSSDLHAPEKAMVKTRLEYSYPTDDLEIPMIRFETVSEIFQTGCESRVRKLATAIMPLDYVREYGLATIVAKYIAAGYASIGVNTETNASGTNKTES
jgi:hypothetical protein